MAVLKGFVDAELDDFAQAGRAGRTGDAWRSLERAHVLSQPDAWQHTRVHFAMLGYAMALGDWREVRGQVMRIAVAAAGSLLGRAPAGNTGRAAVPLMAVMPVPSDLAAKLEAARPGRRGARKG